MAELALLIIFPALMAYAAASDLFTMTIPNEVSLALVVAFPVVALAAGLPWDIALWHVAAGVTVLAACFAMFAFGWIGGGDAKLASVIALWLGFNQTVVEFLVIAAIAGGALTLVILSLRALPLPAFADRWEWLGRLHSRTGGVPYGIALAAAALAVYPHSPIWLSATAG
jgi:prepilin peptidase CpaA